jgi:photosystem II stability/assembly factor-like uncharacterized protein
MNKFKVSLFLLLINSIQLKGQWNLATGTGTNEINTIDIQSSNNIFAGGVDVFLSSTNGGTIWNFYPIRDLSNITIPVSFITTMKFLSPNLGFMTGSILAGNSEMILKTTNSGINWNPVSTSNSGNLPRDLNKLVFPNPTEGFAVGTNGRILYSNNSGNTWNALNSGVFIELNDITFTGSQTAFIAGDSIILKTTNNGFSWSSTNFTGVEFKSLSFINSTTGYAAGSPKALYKTTDGGNSWTPVTVNLPYNAGFSSIHFLTQDTGYATYYESILRTTNGGINWDQFEAGSGIMMNEVKFQNSSYGFACGEMGRLYYTTNPAIAFHPIALFNASNQVCHDSTLFFTNNSSSSYSFSWLRNGQLIDTNYNTSITFSTPATTETISLVAFNGIYYDTANLVISVPLSLQIINNAVIPVDTICPGQSTNCVVNNSQPGTLYSLFINGIHTGNSQSGNGSNLTFNTGAINNNLNAMMKATRLVPGCGQTYDSVSIPIVMGFPDLSIPVTVSNDSICKGDTVIITIMNTEIDAIYQLFKGNTAIGGIIAGNNGVLQFSSGPVYSNSIFTIKATNTLYNCSTDLNQSITILVEEVKSINSASTVNPELGEPVSWQQNSMTYGGNIFWEFGPSAVPPTSTLQNPIVAYNTTGTWPAQLITTSPHGCTDTLTRIINVIQPFVNNSCWLNTFVSFSTPHSIIGLTHDKNDNMYTWQQVGPVDSFYTSAHHGDFLTDTFNDYYYGKHYFLNKYNSKGVPMWYTRIDYPYTQMGTGDIAVDSSGNIFVAFEFDDAGPGWDSLRFYSADKSRHSTILYPPASSVAVFLVKYNNEGYYQWSKHFFEPYYFENLSVKIDSYQNIYVGTDNQIVKYDTDGNTVWPVNSIKAIGMGIDNQDKIYAVGQLSLAFDVYDSLGNILMHVPNVTTIASNTQLLPKFIRTDVGGNIYIAGNFHGSFLFNNDTITDSYVSGPLHNDIFIAKYNSAGQKIWVKQIHAQGGNHLNGFEIRNKNILLMGNTSNYTLYSDLNSALTFQYGTGFYLYYTDTAGVVDELTQLTDDYDGNIYEHAMEFKNTSDDLSIAIPYSHPFSQGTITFDTISSGNYRNNCILNGSIQCMFDSILITHVPREYNLLDVEIVPNPVHDFLKVKNNETAQIQFQIIDNYGKKLLGGTIEDLTFNIDVSNLVNGFYIISMYTDKKIYNQKIIKN